VASKRRIRRKQCSSKMRYVDRAQALHMAQKAWYRTGGQKIHAYHCGHCNGWHIGHWRRLTFSVEQQKTC
jgi:hypothetical protein